MRRPKGWWLSLLCVLSAVLGGILPAPQARAAMMLLDYGERVNAMYYYVVSGTNRPSGGFTWFQPFNVVEPGWEIETIGVAGRKMLSDESSIIGTIVADVAGRPDEANPIVAGSYLFTSREVVWVYATIDVTLPEGRYWMIFSASTPDSYSALRKGTTGPKGFGRRGSDGVEFNYDASTLRITGQVIPEPATLLLLGLGGLAVIRRRRR